MANRKRPGEAVKLVQRRQMVYKYTFCFINVAEDGTTTCTDVETVVTGSKKGERLLKILGEKLGGKVCIKSEEESVKLSLPLDDFIALCMEWMQGNEEVIEQNDDANI